MNDEIHIATIRLLRDFKAELKKIKNIFDSPDDNVLLTGPAYLRMKLKRIYPRILTVASTLRNLENRQFSLKKEILALEKTRKKYYDEFTRFQIAKTERMKLAVFTEKEEKSIRYELLNRQKNLIKEKKKVDNLQEELLIKQNELQVAIQDTNLAKTSYYHLSDAEIELFENQREKILRGVEAYGSISLACQKDRSITMRVSSIMHYAKKHKQFAADLEIAKQVFKDSLDAEIVDRALNGTKNPVFQKGEYIGDYAVKDNKLLVEVAKAKLPETYNPRAYAAANPQGPAGTTINILSFDGVDETKSGYAKNIGVVKSVDESGRVERITQEKKMIDFYKNKSGADIIEAEVVDSGDATDKE